MKNHWPRPIQKGEPKSICKLKAPENAQYQKSAEKILVVQKLNSLETRDIAWIKGLDHCLSFYFVINWIIIWPLNTYLTCYHIISVKQLVTLFVMQMIMHKFMKEPSFLPSTIREWNKLRTEHMNAESLNTFKQIQAEDTPIFPNYYFSTLSSIRNAVLWITIYTDPTWHLVQIVKITIIICLWVYRMMILGMKW